MRARTSIAPRTSPFVVPLCRPSLSCIFVVLLSSHPAAGIRRRAWTKRGDKGMEREFCEPYRVAVLFFRNLVPGASYFAGGFVRTGRTGLCSLTPLGSEPRPVWPLGSHLRPGALRGRDYGGRAGGTACEAVLHQPTGCKTGSHPVSQSPPAPHPYSHTPTR